jgi:outer membrane protein assembly factor BamB
MIETVFRASGRNRSCRTKAICFLIAITFTFSSVTVVSWNQGCFSRVTSISKLLSSDSSNTTNSNQSGDDWPMYGGDLAHTSSVTTTPVQGSQPTWQFDTGDSDWSSPAISGGRVYVVGTDLFCLNVTTGATIWDQAMNDAGSAPAVAGDSVVIGSGNASVLCFDAVTGQLIWNYVTGGPVSSSPAVANGQVFIGSGDANVYCLNLSNGTKIWNYTTNGPVDESPAIDNGRALVENNDGNVYCLNDTTGSRLWNYTTYTYDYSPVVADGCIYIGTPTIPELLCLNATTGTFVWSFNFQSISTQQSQQFECFQPAVANGRVYTATLETGAVGINNLFCLNASTGDLLWRGDGDYTPSIGGGLVYDLFGAPMNSMYLFCENATTGAEVWNYTLTINVGIIGGVPIAIAGGHLFFKEYGNITYCLPMMLVAASPPTVEGAPSAMIACIFFLAGITVVVVERRKILAR